MNKIEKYYVDGEGNTKVVMSQNTAKELRYVIAGFEAGQMYANANVAKQELGQYIAREYLDEEIMSVILASNWYEANRFVDAVKDKIDELLP